VAILGTGGGDPYIGKLMAQQAIRRRDQLFVPCAMMGALPVMVENPASAQTDGLPIVATPGRVTPRAPISDDPAWAARGCGRIPLHTSMAHSGRDRLGRTAPFWL
jgi:hypothetical protein